MELWIPDTVNKTLLEERISDFLKKGGRPYQSVIQERIHSMYPQVNLHQTLYIADVKQKELKIKEPLQGDGKPYPVHKCAICHEEDNVVRHTLPCNHTFHIHCIQRWFLNNSTCPLCRLDCSNYY